MVFSAKELENITQGRWKNLKSDMLFESFNFNVAHAKKNDFFVTRSSEQYSQLKKGNEHELFYLEEIGVGAIMIRDVEFDTSLPALIVKNTKEAFEKIAIATRQKIDAKIILVTGSYGKTGFKTRLHHLIKNEMKTKIVANSSNENSGIYKALSIIHKEDEVAIIEVGVSGLEKAITRSMLVKPDICVITSIGHEHIEKHKTIDNTIFNKAAVTQSLSENGIVVIQKDDYFEKLKNAIATHNPHAIIQTFGADATCDAYIIKKEFVDFGWDVQASIAGKIIEYHIPFIDIHSVEASLSEFLVANILGLNLEKIAPRYLHNEHYKSSGILYEIELLEQKRFFLYDQSRRGGIENYENFFKTLSFIKPQNSGKKILFTSAFVDHEDNEMDNMNPYSFQKLILGADIDALFSVERFSDHLEVLKDKTIWKKHNYDYEKIKDDVLEYVSSDDILFVKGIFESNLHKFIKYIKSFPHAKVKEYIKEETRYVAEQLSITHLNLYKEKLKESNNIAWCYHFPFLLSFAKSKSKKLLVEEMDGSLIIYLLRNADTTKPKLELFFPPLPMNETALKKAQEKIYAFKNKKTSNILWVDEKDKTLVSKHFKLIEKEEGFIYATQNVLQLSGFVFKNLRYNLKKFSSHKNVLIRDYQMDDYFSCIQLSKEWTSQQKDKYDSIYDLEYTKETLKSVSLFDKDDLFGKVVFIDNQLKAFGFAGLMYENVGNIFILKADVSIVGLGYFLKYELIKEMKNCQYINDSSHLGYEGLKNAKQSFGPIQMHKIYKARDGY